MRITRTLTSYLSRRIHPGCLSSLSSVPSHGVHTTSVYQFPGQLWRKKKGMPKNINAYGPLTDGPDYVFVDGRPTPPGPGRIKRAEKQIELTEKIMQITSEVDYAVANHERRLKMEEAERQKILSKKLKSKGTAPPDA